MSTRLPFACLPANEQARAKSMFFDARVDDGYVYELDCDGRVLCRNRSTSKPEFIALSTAHPGRRDDGTG